MNEAEELGLIMLIMFSYLGLVLYMVNTIFSTKKIKVAKICIHILAFICPLALFKMRDEFKKHKQTGKND